MHPKITPEHLGRGAVVYIRQSTMGQVAEHTESQRRQYALADSARTYGFASVTVIDDGLMGGWAAVLVSHGQLPDSGCRSFSLHQKQRHSIEGRRTSPYPTHPQDTFSRL